MKQDFSLMQDKLPNCFRTDWQKVLIGFRHLNFITRFFSLYYSFILCFLYACIPAAVP
jgi:hypothetical protein